MQNSVPYLKDRSHVPFICKNVQKSILLFMNVYKVNYIGLRVTLGVVLHLF